MKSQLFLALVLFAIVLPAVFTIGNVCAATECQNIDNSTKVLLDEMFRTHMNYFLSTNAITSYGLPLTAYKVGDRARYGYSNPTEWGYLLQAYVAAAERGIITQSTAIQKINISLSTMSALQNNANQNYRGLFYPYYKVTQTFSPGNDVFPYRDSNVNIPSIDNGLLYSSLLITEGWAKKINNSVIENKAKAIKDKMNFSMFLFSQSGKKYIAHVISATTGQLGASKWDVYADEGGLMSIIAYTSNSINFSTYQELTNSQMRTPAVWNGYTVAEAAWFNAMFTWGTRPLAGFKIIGNNYSINSFVPTTKAHLAYGNFIGVDYPGFSDAMTQPGGVGRYTPPNLANEVPLTVPTSITPHALFIPLNIIADLDNATINTLKAKISLLKNDAAGYYHNSGSYPYGFEVLASPYMNKTNFSAGDGRNIFETLSEAYTVLSLFNALQCIDNSNDFYKIAINAPGYGAKVNSILNFLYNAPIPVTCTDSDNGLNYFLKGSANGKLLSLNGGIGTKTDACLDSNRLNEFTCNASDYVRSNVYNCTAVMGKEYSCINGACVKNEAIANQTCTDSDNGINYTKQGITTGKFLSLNGGIGTKTDSCTPAGSLVEFSCNSSQYVISSTYNCTSKMGEGYYCSNGACVKNATDSEPANATANQTCTDSDGGLNYTLKGTTTNSTKIFADTCRNATVLDEGYCNGTVVKTFGTKCLFGCANGACVNCIVPYDGMNITQNTTFCGGDYYLPKGMNIIADYITLDCNGSTLYDYGNNSVYKAGLTLINRGYNLVKNCIIQNYSRGVYDYGGAVNTYANNTFLDDSGGIYIEETKTDLIVGNRIINSFKLFNNSMSSVWNGIFLGRSSLFNIIDSNIINSSEHGIIVQEYSNYNIIRNNYVLRSGIYGIESWAVYSDRPAYNNTYINNTVVNCSRGFFIYRSKGNLFENNNAINNSVGFAMDESANNTLHHNNLINNEFQVSISPGFLNAWDKNGEGNYWSNYDTPAEGCADANTNGICDAPFKVPDNGRNITFDYFPLVKALLGG